MARDDFWGTFRRWRRHRPFWGGLLLVLSALELFLSANMALGGVEVHLGPQGFLSYLLPIMLLVCGLLCIFSPAQRLFYGIISLLAALYSFLGLNLGGFFIGMLLGIVGGALVIAWGPPRIRPEVTEGDEPPTAGEPDGFFQDGPAAYSGSGEPFDRSGEPYDRDATQQIDIAGHDDRPHEQPVRRAAQESDTSAIMPGFSLPEDARPSAASRLGKNPKALAVGLIALVVTGSFLIAGSKMPASADACPAGLPSRSTSASASAATTTGAAAAAAKKAVKTTRPAAKTVAPKTTTKSAASSSSPAPAPAAEDDAGNPILNGIHDLVDGVGNLLGINGEETPSPSESPTPSETAADPATTTAPAETTAPTVEPTKTTAPAEEPTKTTAPASSAPAQPTASGSEIPCLGARIFGKVASADDIPVVAKKPGLMEVDSLTLYNSTYDGVVDMPTAGGGSYKSLKFSMTKAVNKPFSLTMDEAGNAQTVIKSNELVTDGNVKFYTPELKGKLFGLIPVTFTPEQPPPLTLPVLWFTDVTIQLAFVRCDTLTADPLDLREKL